MPTHKELTNRIGNLLTYREKQVRRVKDLANELEETDPDYKRLSPEYKKDFLETRKAEIIRDQDRDFQPRIEGLKRDVGQAKNEIARTDFEGRTGLKALRSITDTLGISPELALRLTDHYLDQGNIGNLMKSRSEFTDNILRIGKAINKIPETEKLNDVFNIDTERPDFQKIDELMSRFDVNRDNFVGLTPFDITG